jgi:hypothetical protein
VEAACIFALPSFVAAVDRHRALDDVQGQEAEDRGEHGQWNAEQLAGLLGECFGHQVEADDTEREPGGEPEDEVLLVVGAPPSQTDGRHSGLWRFTALAHTISLGLDPLG